MSETATGPAEGQPAPDFSMPASGGRIVSLEGLRGRPFLLYFYPKADTPGCTKQACGIQEALPQLGRVCGSLGVLSTVNGSTRDSAALIWLWARRRSTMRVAASCALDSESAITAPYCLQIQRRQSGGQQSPFPLPRALGGER